MTATNHVFPRPCPDPEDHMLLTAVGVLMDGGIGGIERGALRTIMDACHGDAVAAGWHHDIATGKPKERNRGEMFMLAVSEIAEAMEGHRKTLPDDKLPHRPMIEVEFADFMIRCGDTLALPDFADSLRMLDTNPIKARNRIWDDHPDDNVGSRLMRICFQMHKAHHRLSEGLNGAAGLSIIQGMRYCADQARLLGLDLAGAVVEKRNYNRTRKDHSVAARLSDGGKSY